MSGPDVEPPDEVGTFWDFLRWQSDIKGTFYIYEVEGERYLHAYGPAASWLGSGPTAYVFDKSSRLVDWTADIGDNVRFEAAWPGSAVEDTMELREAVAWFSVE